MLLSLVLSSLASLATVNGHSSGTSQPSREQALANAWAKTGDCASATLAGLCGAAAVAVNHTHAPVVTVAAGGAPPNSTAAFGPHTMFEIASMTKVFTAIAFHRLVREGLMQETDTVGDVIGVSVHPPVSNITMRELISHTSGLLLLPDNLHGSPSNSFTNYSAVDLFNYLGSVHTLRTRGRFLYSNLGFGLLGYLMELHMKQPYEKLLADLILIPLGMNGTKVELSTSEWNHLVAPGRYKNGSVAERRTPYGILKGQ